jgi:hypothetical protein
MLGTSRQHSFVSPFLSKEQDAKELLFGKLGQAGSSCITCQK